MRHRFFAGWLRAGLCSWVLLLMVLGVCSTVTLLGERSAIAQDDELVEADEEVPAAAPGAAAPEAPRRESTLQWMFKSLGWMYSVVFLSLSFTLVALFVMNLLMARRENVVPVALVEGFEAHLNEKRYQEAYEMAKNDESFLGQVLSAGLAKLSTGYDQAIEAMQEVGEEENMKMEHRLSYMALIGTISPMVGLLGTVQGMIASFSVIANSPTAPKPSELAVGISTALFTTLVGLFIAIPAIAAYNIIRNRIQRLVLEVGILSEGLMSRFASVGKKPA
ncbi:MAG: MotA/TolQ/ExbB proton channel family protein [Thermoguttaceae bacterium]|nr:MotA/TolQ/ExbB proton channel family protein [Thermoguttaceae bacterium]